MKKMNTAELCSLEVINLCGGESLGYPTGVEIDLDCGNILALTVSSCKGFLLLEKREDFVRPWRSIECIGEDAILVKIDRNNFSDNSAPCRKGKTHRLFSSSCK